MPMTCATLRRTPRIGGPRGPRSSQPGLVEGALQRLEVAVAGDGGAADHVDVGALGVDGLLGEDRAVRSC